MLGASKTPKNVANLLKLRSDRQSDARELKRFA